MAAKRTKKSEGPRSLASTHIDLRSRLGAVAPATTTGLPSLDELLGGGFRLGTHLLVAGGPGVGKTAFALMLAYMAARARASVLFTSVGLDDTEVIARLTARAVHREYQNVAATYGTIWSGVSLQEPTLRGPITGCLDSVVKKVGDYLHLHAADPMEDVSSIAEHAAYLWSRNERVVIVVDGVEAYSATQGDVAPSGYDARLSLVAYELSRLAREGCAVVSTCQSAAAQLVSPAATVAAELRPPRMPPSRGNMKKKPALDSRPMELAVLKNRLGPTPTLPLLHLPAASVFEEQRAAT